MEPERSSPAIAGPDAKAILNGILKNVMQHLLNGVPHANFFRNPVSCVVVDDYRDYVPAGQDMCLGRILERTESQYYSDVATFRADLQLMYDNAAAYNGRNGGKHAYEPVIHWAANMLAAAYKELCHYMPLEAPDGGEQKPPSLTKSQLDAPTPEAAWDPTTAPSAPAADVAAATERPSGASIPTRLSPIDQCHDVKPSPLRPVSQERLLAKSQQPHQADQQPQADQRTLDPMQEQQQHVQQRISVAGNGQGSPRAANGSSAGQQSSSPSSGSGAGSHSGLEALLAACELAAEQDSTARRDGAAVAVATAGPPAAGGGGSGSDDAPPERRSFPGSSGQSKQSEQPEQQQQEEEEHQQQQELALVAFEPVHDGCAGPGLMSAGKSQQQREDPAGSSEGGGMELCCLPSGVGSGGGPEGAATMAQAGGSGGGGRDMVVAGGGGGAGGSYLASNAFKNRRHKSKVYIKPNKVVYLPTTFVEEEFDVAALPLDCELRVEADGVLTDETFRVTIKAVPRQGLSTMYCMTNVMRFQQQYLNWQIYNWTRIDNTHIKIHLQSPSPSQTHLQRPDLDRSASMPEQVGRNFPFRASEDGAFGYQARGGGGAVAASSLKRKSDTGRYNVTRVERRLAPEPGREMLPLELRLSSTGYAQYPSPIPESPPASPQRRVSACPAVTAATVGMGTALPPRAPANHGPIPARLSGAQQFSLQSQQSHHQQQQQHIHQQQIQIHHHHHYTGGHFQNQPIQSLYHQQHSHSHSHPHPPHHSGVSGNNPLSLPFSIGQIQQSQAQRGSNSSILTKQDQQTCSEDSSGPVVGADMAPGGGPMLAWHPSAPAGGGGGGGSAVRSARLSGGPAAAAARAAVLQQFEVQDLAGQLQAQAGGELSALGALQLAIVALQQQQEHQHSLLMAALPRGSADGGGGGGGGIAPLDLANAADQERLLQQLALGALAHPHARAPRWSSGRQESIDGAPNMDFGGQRGPSSSGALDAYMHQQPTASSHLYHDDQQQQQHRRSSQGERSRQGVATPQGCKQAGHQQHRNEDNLTSGADTVPDAVALAAAAQAVEQQLGGMTMEVEGQQHPPRYARHSVTGTGLHVVSGGAGGANKLFPAGIGSLVSAGGRIRFDVGPAPGGAVTAMGPRASANGRRLQGGGNTASIVSDITDHLAQAAAAAFPGGLGIPDDVLPLLSPTKRYKVAVTTDNPATAAVGGESGGSQELPVLDMLSGLRAAAAAAAGARSLQAEAALTALRLGGGGPQAANVLNGRSFLPVGPEILGQLM